MDKSSQAPKGHIRSFWPLVIIFVITAILGGLIYSYQVSLTTDYDLNSLVFTVNRRKSTTGSTVKKPTTRTGTSTTTK
jgi:hypothetical protein